MQDSTVTLLASLTSGLAGISGALGAVFLTNRAQNFRHDADIVRDRGEELYSAIVEWLDGLFAYYFRRSFVMQGKITYNECLEQDIEWGNKKQTPPTMLRMEMLLDVYFPKLRPAYDEVIRLRTALNRVEGAFRRRY